MNFCSHCGSPQLSFNIPPGDHLPRYSCASCQTIFYANPKVVTGCLVVFDGRILLCRRAIEPRKGLWNLPGGYLENGETAEEGALRETMEEAGVQAEILRLLTVYSLPHVNQVYLHFLAEAGNDQAAGGEETLEAAFFSPSQIPWNELAFSSTRFALEVYLSDLASGQACAHLGHYRKAFE